jgi:hypothetical protein
MVLVVYSTLLPRDMTGTAEVLVGMSVVNEQFTVLAIAARLITSNLDNTEDGLGLAEDRIHLLQGAVGRLRVEEIHNREDEGVAIID